MRWGRKPKPTEHTETEPTRTPLGRVVAAWQETPEEAATRERREASEQEIKATLKRFGSWPWPPRGWWR
jgi:hypothetical protein